MKASKLRDLTAEEINREVEDLREQVYRLRFQAGSAEKENPLRIRFVRRDLARALTVLRQKKMAVKTADEKS